MQEQNGGTTQSTQESICNSSQTADRSSTCTAFLAHTAQTWVFQRRTVVQMVDEVFARYTAAGQAAASSATTRGALLPTWRWALADETIYTERSLCIQHGVSDLQFVWQLLAQEGLFCWFEHASHTSSDNHSSKSLGAPWTSPQPTDTKRFST
jgi:uncharacterized protein involved in type VI secretion and phage assembly